MEENNKGTFKIIDRTRFEAFALAAFMNLLGAEKMLELGEAVGYLKKDK